MDNRTPYSGYSQNQLTALFSAESWSGLSFSERMNACQEVENRYAIENGVKPCVVTHEKMDGACYGWQRGNIICLNTYLVQDGQFRTHFTDQNGVPREIRTNALAPGWNTLDTVYHEGTHGIQESTGRMPSTYISPEMDGDLYRIQEIEKEAYAEGQIRTLNAISTYENEIGHLDSDRNEYITSVKNDAFQAALADAARNYNDPNIEQTLQNVIDDRENNFIRENTTESYQAISNLCDAYGLHSSVDVSRPEELSANPQPGLEPHSAAISSTTENAGQGEEKPAGTEVNVIDDGMRSAETGFEETVADDGMNDTNSEYAAAVNGQIGNEASSISAENDGMESAKEDLDLETIDVPDGIEEEAPATGVVTYGDGSDSVESTSDYGGSCIDYGSNISSDGYSGDDSAEGYSDGSESFASGGISVED